MAQKPADNQFTLEELNIIHDALVFTISCVNTQEIPAGDEGFVYVLSGQAYFSSKRTSMSAGQVGHLAHTSAYEGFRIEFTPKRGF